MQAFDGHHIADAALYLMHHQQDLGIKDPHELTEERVQGGAGSAACAIVNRYWHDAFVQIDDFTNEGVVASSSWPFQVNILVSRASRSRAWSGRGRDRLGGHHRNARRGAAPELRGGWSGRSAPISRAIRRWFGSVPVVLDACNKASCSGRAFRKTNGLELRADPLLAHAGRHRAPARRVRALPGGLGYIAVLGGR